MTLDKSVILETQTHKDSALEIINKAITIGISDLEEVAIKTKLPLLLVYKVAVKHELPLTINPKTRMDIIKNKNKPIPDYVIATRRESIDELIPLGSTLEKMSEICGLSKEGIRKYVIRTNKENLWKAAKKKNKQEEKEREKFIGSIVCSVTQYLYEKAELAEQKVFEYFNRIKRRSILSRSTAKLLRLYQRYLEAKNKGEKKSLSKLSEGLELWESVSGKALHTVGLCPLYGSMQRKTIPKEKKEALERASIIKMNCPDIAYFLKLNQWNVFEYFNKHQKKKLRGRANKYHLINFGKGEILTYRVASQIYEARDSGFTKEEIIELLDKKEKVVDYAFQNEKTIAPEIIKTLKILYPNKEIEKPYK